MNLEKIKSAYRSQRSSATKKRNIDWQFTFETWLAWWGEDIVHRGRGKGKLVQARIGDTGPYSPENCIKLTHKQNLIDAHKGRSKSAEHRAKMQGRKHTSASRIKMSMAQKGKTKTPEHKKALSESKKGKPNPKISASRTGKKYSPQTPAHIAKRVLSTSITKAEKRQSHPA